MNNRNIDDWPEVAPFADIMRERLEVNREKGGWDNCSDEFLVAKLAEEFGELVLSVRDGVSTREQVGEEAADLANIAMMLADNWGALGEPE